RTGDGEHSGQGQHVRRNARDRTRREPLHQPQPRPHRRRKGDPAVQGRPARRPSGTGYVAHRTSLAPAASRRPGRGVNRGPWLRELLRQAARSFPSSDVALWAAGATFFGLLGLVPLALVALRLAGALVGTDGVAAGMATAVSGLPAGHGTP